MYEMISTKDMNHLDWLKMRKTGIGGSDAGAICGLNPYASAMSVFTIRLQKSRKWRITKP